jgi:hypothetical protein
MTPKQGKTSSIAKSLPSCKSCRFWNVHGGKHTDFIYYESSGTVEDVERPHRKCFAVIHGNESGAGVDTSSVRAFVTDGSGYAASFWTHPDFNCSLYEKANGIP